MEGWIKLHRKLIEWEWYSDSKTVHLLIHLLLSANHKANKWQGHTINRGQLITGRDKLSAATGISQQSIRTILTRLETSKIIETKSTNKFTIITVINYESYQDGEEDVNQQSTSTATSNQPTSNQQSTTNKNVKNEKKFKKPTLSELNDYIKTRTVKIDPHRFIDFYESNGWRVGKNPMKNWKAAVNGWEKRQLDDKPKTNRRKENIW